MSIFSSGSNFRKTSLYMVGLNADTIKQIEQLKFSIRQDLNPEDWEYLPQARIEVDKSLKEKTRRVLIKYSQMIHSKFIYLGVRSVYVESFLLVFIVTLAIVTILLLYSNIETKGLEGSILEGIFFVFPLLYNVDGFMLYVLDNPTLLCSLFIGLIVSLPVMVQDQLLVTQAEVSKMSPRERIRLYAKLEIQEELLEKDYERFRETLKKEEGYLQKF